MLLCLGKHKSMETCVWISFLSHGERRRQRHVKRICCSSMCGKLDLSHKFTHPNTHSHKHIPQSYDCWWISYTHAPRTQTPNRNHHHHHRLEKPFTTESEYSFQHFLSDAIDIYYISTGDTNSFLSDDMCLKSWWLLLITLLCELVIHQHHTHTHKGLKGLYSVWWIWKHLLIYLKKSRLSNPVHNIPIDNNIMQQFIGVLCTYLILY